MRYYDDSDDLNDENVNKFFQEDISSFEEDFDELLEERQINQEFKYNFLERDSNQKTLRMAVRMCEKSFWWKFYSFKTKLKMIQESYLLIKALETEE
jgi:hypothetical protein